MLKNKKIKHSQKLLRKVAKILLTQELYLIDILILQKINFYFQIQFDFLILIKPLKSIENLFKLCSN